MTTNIKHYDNLAIVLDDFDIWGGRTALSESDFKIGVGGELPPSAIASLGNKKIINSDHLRGFNRLKTSTRRFLLRYGMPFLNGVAVPVDKLDEITQKLDLIGFEFESLKNAFLQNYETAIQDWSNSHAEYRDVILRNALTREEVEKRLRFEYQVFMVTASKDEAQNKKLDSKVELLGEELLSEVCDTAKDLYDKHFAGRLRCGVRAHSLIQQLRDKVDGLSFLNGYLTPLVQMMDSALSLFNNTSNGYVEAPDFWYVSSVVLILSQRRTISQYANGEISVQSTAFGLQGQGSDPLLADSDNNQAKELDTVLANPTDLHITGLEQKDSLNLKDPLPPQEGHTKDLESDLDRFFSNYKQDRSVKDEQNEQAATQAVITHSTSKPDVDDHKESKVVVEQKSESESAMIESLDEAFALDDEPTFF